MSGKADRSEQVSMPKTDNPKEIVTAAVLGWMHDLAPQGFIFDG